jgi:hypothetical protein
MFIRDDFQSKNSPNLREGMKRKLMKIGDDRVWCLLISQMKKHLQLNWLGLDL